MGFKEKSKQLVTSIRTGRSVSYGWQAYLIAAAVTIAVGFLTFYLALPALNPRYTGFWWFLFWLTLVFTVSLFIAGSGISALRVHSAERIQQAKKPGAGGFLLKNFSLVGLGIMLLLLLIVILGSIFSSTFFHARDYAGIIDVKDAVFKDDMPESERITNIALMDGASAVIIGNKTLGQLSHVVSQYEVSTNYTQINIAERPYKVANLEHADFFKWFNNREKGIPGYVKVDPVNATAEYVELDQHIRYVESAYFGDDLMRKLRFEYPTKIFGSTRFEVDNDGNPWFVVSCLAPRVGLFGAKDVSEVIIFNPINGESSIYDVDKTPSWIDAAYDGDLAMQKYNWFGTLSGGFWNSIIGNVDCKRATDDYGYIAIGDDIWYYTGVTSLTSDESNIGFMLCNARTGEYKYYQVAGADEAAAMGSAEGKLQQFGYKASFPALVNVSGNATYVMVLKDNHGLVKSYALVNVEHYELVATGDTQEKAFAEYKKLLSEIGAVDEGDTETYTVTVERVRDLMLDGNTVIYFYGDDGVVYCAYLAENEAYVLIEEGDTITFTCEKNADASVRRVISYECLTEQPTE